MFGTRTAYGLRRLLVERNDEQPVVLDFPWMMRPNADHYTFFAKSIPVVFFHTGLHERYHLPSDDAAHINAEGMMRVVRLVFATAYELAEADAAPRFRPASGQETDQQRQQASQPDPSPVGPGDPPLRVGISWRVDEAEPGTVVISHVVADSPAAGRFAGRRPCVSDRRPRFRRRHGFWRSGPDAARSVGSAH